MNYFQKKKRENVIEMFGFLGEIYKKMQETELKKDYRRLLYFFQSNRADLKKILESIDKKIIIYQTATNKIVGLENEYVVRFWKNIKRIILDTYIENKKLNRSL